MKKIFITSAGTDNGKTLVTCGLAKVIKDSSILKPIISGFKFEQKPNDLYLYCKALNIPYTKQSIKKLSAYFFDKPLSPDMAASGKSQADLKHLIKFCDSSSATNVLIEIAGGVMTPVNDKHTFLDLIKASADETILVSGSYLGSLSHTLSAYRLLKDNFKAPKLLVVSQNLPKSDKSHIPLSQTIKSLEKFVPVPIIGVEKLAGNDVARINRIAEIFDGSEVLKKIRRKS